MTDLTEHRLPDASNAHFEPEQGAIWVAAEGQIVNLGVFLLCLLGFWLVLPMVYALYRFLVVNAHVYLLTDQRLRETSGLFFKKTEVLELYRVKDISIEQPPLQRLVGCGRVILRTSDRSTPIVILNAIPKPQVVANLLRDQVESCRVAKGVREID